VTNPSINYWKFEVIYRFEMGISSSSINFKKNSPPSNGNCSINPLNGTTTTLFNISCSNWFDENGIKDYSFYGFIFYLFIRMIVFLIFSLDK
jgi:hypothetical protein